MSAQEGVGVDLKRLKVGLRAVVADGHAHNASHSLLPELCLHLCNKIKSETLSDLTARPLNEPKGNLKLP